MSKQDEFSRRNLKVASDLIARRSKVRDEYLLGQPFYMDIMRYVADVMDIVLRPRAREGATRKQNIHRCCAFS